MTAIGGNTSVQALVNGLSNRAINATGAALTSTIAQRGTLRSSTARSPISAA